MTHQPTLTNTVADPHLMLAFEGMDTPEWVAQSLESGRPAGFTLFRGWNIESPSQVAELVSDLQARNQGDTPLLIATDQEGGQLQALAGSTAFAGNMAIGATGDEASPARSAQLSGGSFALWVSISTTHPRSMLPHSPAIPPSESAASGPIPPR